MLGLSGRVAPEQVVIRSEGRKVMWKQSKKEV